MFELSWSTEADPSAGAYEVRIIASSALSGREKKNVPLKMKPIEARLLVQSSAPMVAHAYRELRNLEGDW